MFYKVCISDLGQMMNTYNLRVYREGLGLIRRIKK